MVTNGPPSTVLTVPFPCPVYPSEDRMKINDGCHKTKVFEIREIELKNFSPMVWNLILKHNWLEGYVQAKIDFFGNLIWINVRRNKVMYDLDS